MRTEDVDQTRPPTGDDGGEDLGEFDAFLSYSRRDRLLVRRIESSLEAARRRVWVDLDDIAPAAEWTLEIERAIEASHSFIFIITAASVGSSECGRELDAAVALGKRILPVLAQEAENVPPPLSSRQYVLLRERDDFDQGIRALVSAMDTDPEWVHAHTHWLQMARRWESHGRDRSLLVRGSELKSAEGWLAADAGREPRPTAVQVAFVEESRRAARRRRRTLVAAAAATALVVGGLGLVALLTNREADQQRTDAQSRRDAQRSRSLLATDPLGSLRVAVRAFSSHPSADSSLALREAVAAPLATILSVGPTRVGAAALAPDGARVAGGTEDGRLLVWDLRAGGAPQVLERTGPAVKKVAFSPDGTHVLGLAGSRVRVWRAAGGALLRAVTWPDRSAISTFAGPTGGGRLLLGHAAGVGERQGAVRITSLDDPGAAAVLRDLPPVEAIALDPSGRRAAIGGLGDPGVRLAAVPGGEPAGLLSGGSHPVRVTGVSFSPDGRLVAASGDDGSLRVWQGRQDVPLRNFRVPNTIEFNGLNAVALSSADQLAAAAGDDGLIRVWGVRARGEVPSVLRGHRGNTWAVGFDRAASRLVTAGEDGTVRIWSLGGGGIPRVLGAHRAADLAAAVSPDGRLAAIGSEDGMVRIVDVRNGREIRDVRVGAFVNGVAFSPDGRTVGAGVADWTVWLIPATGSGAARTLKGARGPVYGVAFSPNGRLLAATGGREVRLWDARGRPLGALRPREATNLDKVAFSPDSGMLAAGGDDGGIGLWRLPDRTAVGTLTGHRGFVYGLDFSRDGTRLVSAGQDGRVRIWDLRTREPRVLTAGSGTVLSARFSPDGKRILAAGTDGVMRLWDLEYLGPPLQLPGKGGALVAALFTPDGARLLSAGADGVVRVWPCAACGPVSAVLAGARRALPAAPLVAPAP